MVTGANKGIGHEIVRQLASKGITVVLTARDETRGRAAVEGLHSQGLQNVDFHTLDIAVPESITAFATWLKGKYGGVHILVPIETLSSTCIDCVSIFTRCVPDSTILSLDPILGRLRS